MSILTVNLKHLYQRRAFWLFYPFVALFTPALVLGSYKDGSRSMALLLVFIIGLILGSGQREVLSHSFTYLLPRHTGVVPRLALVQSAFFGLFAPLCWLRLPHSAPTQHLAILLSAWLLGMACYLGGTLASFTLPFVTPLLGFLPLIAFGGVFLTLPAIIETAVGDFPFRSALVALLGILCAWRFLRRHELARHWALRRSIAFFDEFNLARANEFHQWRRAAKMANQPEPGSPALIRFLLARIATTTPMDLFRYAWATWYEWFGLLTPKRWLGMLLMWPVLTAFLGYFSGGPKSVIVFVMPTIMVVSLRRTYLSPYLSAGRPQRHLATVAGMLVITAFNGGMAWLFVLTSRLIAPSMPPMVSPMGKLIFEPFPYLYALITTALIPLAFAAAIWLRKKSSILVLALVPTVPVLVILMRHPPSLPLVYWPLPPLVCLLLSVGILRYHCLRRDLV